MNDSKCSRELFALLGLLLTAGILTSFFPTSARAQQRPMPEVYRPDALEPWVGWVLDRHSERHCSQIGERFVCEWPGRLALDVEPAGGTFTLEVFTQRDEALVRLPGGARYWPQEVRVDGAEAVVFEVSDPSASSDATRRLPAIRVPRKGRATVSGRFFWRMAPEVLQVPSDVAQIDLTLSGESVAWPRVDATGQLFVKEGSAVSASEADTVRVATYRHVQDGIPLRVSTLFELNVAGRAREMSLGKPLLAHGKPVRVKGDLPVQIGADGVVEVYVRPGRYVVEIESVFASEVEALSVPAQPAPFFDPVEYWVWSPREELRSVELGGLLAIDPSRTTLPQELQNRTTFVARPGESLQLDVTRRGESEQPPNQLEVRRKMWLDLDGHGLTIRDQITGTMHQGWRLDYQKGAGQLGRVVKKNTPDGSPEPLLITRDTQGAQLSGVELRDARVELEAEVRHLASLDEETLAVGWAHDVQRLEAEISLPPGWSVFAARGVDEMRGTWIDSWDLFELFVVLMIAFAMGKLFGWPWGVISAVALILSHDQGDAPRYVWFHIVAILALLRVLPRKPWVQVPAYSYLAIALVVMVSIFGYYAKHQVRIGLHPQVERPFQSNASSGLFLSDEKSMAFDDSLDVIERESRTLSSASGMNNEVPGSNADKMGWGGRAKGVNSYQQIQQQIDPGEVVQTGPGVPTWDWKSWPMHWSGPVAREHTFKLWLISPRVNFLCRLLSVLCFLLMTLVVLAPGVFAPRKRVGVDVHRWLKKVLITSILVLPCMMSSYVLMNSREVQAQSIPSTEVLQELERRLLVADRCEGPCVTVSDMRLEIDEQGAMKMTATVHAQRQSAWALPGPAPIVHIDRVWLDDRLDSVALRREVSMDNMVYVRVPKGTHQVNLSGTLQVQNVVTLQLDASARPRHVRLDAPAWSVDGVDTFGRPDASLQLSRKDRTSGDEDGSRSTSGQELPPWYGVERTLLLGLPWQTRTVITRHDDTRPQLVKIPLLTGESILSEGVRVERGEALVNFGRGEKRVEYLSEFSVPMQERGEVATITLQAPKDVPWSETWRLDCSRIWRCSHEGLVPTTTVDDRSYSPVWHPWPGEEVTLGVKKPQGTQGDASTVTGVTYEVSPGKRRLLAKLNLEIRASQGTWQKITLPEGAELQGVQIDGAARSIRPEENGVDVSLPVEPGTHVFQLEWIQPWEHHFNEQFPEVDLGSEAVNISLVMNLNPNRWLLWTSGPDWGPAVLFWSHLILLVLLALLLGRLKPLPLRTYQWLLLVLGMSQLPLLALIPVVGWFGLLVWRQERPLPQAVAFNLVQVSIIFWTLLTLGVWYAAVHSNLLLDVDMQVSGNGSYNHMLRWYVDRVDGKLPLAGALTVPLLIWRAAMFAWVLWMVSSLIRWLPWAWRSFSAQGLWRDMGLLTSKQKKPESPAPTAHETSADTVTATSDGDGSPHDADGSAN